MKRSSEESIVSACLIAYVVLFLLSFFLLGDRAIWLIVIGFALIPAIVFGNQRQRVLTSGFVIFALTVAVMSVQTARQSASARMRARLDQCERQLADMKTEREKGGNEPAVKTGE